MKLNQLIGDVVRSLDSGAAGIVIVKFPSSEFSIGGNSAFDFDHSRGAEIGPSEFFFAGPDNFHRTVCSARQSGGFQSSVAGMFSAVGRASIGNDDANAVFRNV